MSSSSDVDAEAWDENVRLRQRLLLRERQLQEAQEAHYIEQDRSERLVKRCKRLTNSLQVVAAAGMRRGRAATVEDIRDVRDSLQHLSREMTHVVSLEEALFAKERALDAMSRKSKSAWRSVQKDARQLRSVSSENMILQKRLNGMVRKRLVE